jgi:hypothetical protein
MSSVNVSMRPFILAWLAYTIAIFAIAIGVWIPTGVYKEMDFRPMYTAGLLARTDASHLYDSTRQGELQHALVKNDGLTQPFPHLAFEALLFVPFSFFKYRTAYLLMLLPNSILIVLSFLAARPAFSATIPLWQPRAGFIFFTFMPTMIALAQGQDSLLLLLILCSAWKLLDRSHVFAAGLVMATMLFKPHLALLMALFVAVRYGWRFVAGFIAGTAAAVAVCIPFWLHGGFRAWMGVLSDQSLVSPHTRAQVAGLTIFAWAMPNLRGVLLLLLGRALSSHALFAVVCLASLVLLVWGLVVARRLPARNAFAFSIVMTVLLGYNVESHDLVILLLPMVLMETGASKALARCRDVILALPIALLLLAPANPPGAGFTLMCPPLLAEAFLLSRTVQTRSRREGMALA